MEEEDHPALSLAGIVAGGDGAGGAGGGGCGLGGGGGRRRRRRSEGEGRFPLHHHHRLLKTPSSKRVASCFVLGPGEEGGEEEAGEGSRLVLFGRRGGA